MQERISAGELFDQVGGRLGLRWIAGRQGERRVLESVQTVARRPSLAGYLNAIYPNKVQILGTEELAWLDGLVPAPDASGTALWSPPRRRHEPLTHLQSHLARALAPRVTLHGVFMEIYSIGVLITGESGAGKSELALELVTRGHRLVADDAP